MSPADTICVRCADFPSDGECCCAHRAELCHRCYRRTHFVETPCERPECASCAAEPPRAPAAKPEPTPAATLRQAAEVHHVAVSIAQHFRTDDMATCDCGAEWHSEHLARVALTAARQVTP